MKAFLVLLVITSMMLSGCGYYMYSIVPYEFEKFELPDGTPIQWTCSMGAGGQDDRDVDSSDGRVSGCVEHCNYGRSYAQVVHNDALVMNAVADGYGTGAGITCKTKNFNMDGIKEITFYHDAAASCSGHAGKAHITGPGYNTNADCQGDQSKSITSFTLKRDVADEIVIVYEDDDVSRFGNGQLTFQASASIDLGRPDAMSSISIRNIKIIPEEPEETVDPNAHGDNPPEDTPEVLPDITEVTEDIKEDIEELSDEVKTGGTLFVIIVTLAGIAVVFLVVVAIIAIKKKK
jgi:hypothetical protein